MLTTFALYSILALVINSQDYRRALISFKISIDNDRSRCIFLLYLISLLNHLSKILITFELVEKLIYNLLLVAGEILSQIFRDKTLFL